jgi:hypothetical protein
MTDQTSDDNWLNATIITCPHCKSQLYRVDHSPFYDAYFLYCDACANRVEIGFYDPVFTAITDELTEQGRLDYTSRMAIIEARLRPCACGGHFRHDAARRCHICLTPVISGESDVDLWSEIYGINVDERDPTDEEAAQAEAFDSKHVYRENIWA